VTKQERFQQKQWGQIVARAWADPEFKARLLAEPQAVLREHGIEPEPGVEIRVIEGASDVQYLVLPPCPDGDLAEEELAPTAVGYCYCGWCRACGRCGRCGCGCA
jgi:hypothetical protein